MSPWHRLLGRWHTSRNPDRDQSSDVEFLIGLKALLEYLYGQHAAVLRDVQLVTESALFQIPLLTDPFRRLIESR